MARTKPRPFDVTTLHDEFLNFNSSQLQFTMDVPKKTKNNENSNQKIIFHDAVWIQYRKEYPKSIFIKTDYNDDSFVEFKLKPKKGKSLSIIPKPVFVVQNSERFPISKAKKNDLLKLCNDLLMPRTYHQYFESLPVCDAAVDRLPEPDIEEGDDADWN